MPTFRFGFLMVLPVTLSANTNNEMLKATNNKQYSTSSNITIKSERAASKRYELPIGWKNEAYMD
jgi:hypothetical protein